MKKTISMLFSTLLILSLMSVGLAEARTIRHESDSVDEILVNGDDFKEVLTKSSLKFNERNTLKFRAYNGEVALVINSKHIKPRNFVVKNGVNVLNLPSTVVISGSGVKRQAIKTTFKVTYDENNINIDGCFKYNGEKVCLDITNNNSL